jgi:hypothetical protein
MIGGYWKGQEKNGKKDMKRFPDEEEKQSAGVDDGIRSLDGSITSSMVVNAQ